MKRYAVLITDQGMDTALPLADNPDNALADMKNIVSRDKAEKRAKVIYVLDHGERPDSYQVTSIVDGYLKKISNDISRKHGSVNIGNYMAYDLRKRYAAGGQLEVQVGLEEKWFNAFRGMDPYAAAFYILDICINGKTNYGRFGEKNSQIVMGQNVLKDQSPRMKEKLKIKRREMIGHLHNGSNDSDEI